MISKQTRHASRNYLIYYLAQAMSSGMIATFGANKAAATIVTSIATTRKLLLVVFESSGKSERIEN